MKSYTDIEQSKKLAGILPITTIDFAWNIFNDGSTRLLRMDDWEVFENAKLNVEIIPCWSLAALLDALPSGKVLVHDKGNRGYKCICNNIDTNFHDNPVDACVDMIEKMHKLKML